MILKDASEAQSVSMNPRMGAFVFTQPQHAVPGSVRCVTMCLLKLTGLCYSAADLQVRLCLL